MAVINEGKRPVLIPEGEMLVGAKQNRVVNITVLVAAGRRFILPVSCIEQGRWDTRSDRFRSEHFAPPGLRSLKMESVYASRKERGSSDSDQGAVWEEVAVHLDAARAESATADLADGFKKMKKRTAEYRRKLALPSGACGFIAAGGGRVTGLDLFDAPSTMRTLWKRLSEAYIFEAAVSEKKERKTLRREAVSFLARLTRGAAPAETTLGLGTEIEIRGRSIVGSALCYDGKIRHLAAFRKKSPRPRRDRPVVY